MLLFITFFLACADNRSEEEIHETYIRNRCRSKVNGSSPSCWNEDDWKAKNVPEDDIQRDVTVVMPSLDLFPKTK